MSAEFYRQCRILYFQLWFAWLQMISEFIELGNYYLHEEVPKYQK